MAWFIRESKRLIITTDLVEADDTDATWFGDDTTARKDGVRSA